MDRKLWGAVALVLGLVLVAAGLLLMFVIVPGMKQFPDDVDTTRNYEGTMPVLLNPQTFEFMKDLDVDLVRHFKTEETDGGVALVLEEQTLSTQGQPLQQLVKHYAIDRKTMEVSDEYPEEWATTEGFWAREGLVLGWPIDSEQKDYTGWSDDYRATVTLKYDGEVTHDRSGMETYYFTASSEPRLIDPEAVTAMGLPAALPKDQLIGLIAGTDMPDLIKNALPNMLEAVEGDVPLQYYYGYTAEYWIEPTSGVLIDTHKVETRTVGLAEELLANSPLAALPEEQRAALRIAVFDLDYMATDQSVEDAKKDAQDAIDTIGLYGTTLPLVGIIAGLALAVLGAFLVTRKTA